MTHTILPQFAILGSAFFIAAAELVSGALEAANKVGTMGMQGLLALLMLILGGVIWHLEKRRTVDREARDRLVTKQYDNLLLHHEKFAQEVNTERAGFHNEMKLHAVELRGLTERSIVAMHAMATATDALREHLNRESALPQPRETRETRRLS